MVLVFFFFKHILLLSFKEIITDDSVKHIVMVSKKLNSFY